MLRSMRKNIKSLSITLWGVIFAFIATTFFVWGMGSPSGKGERGVVATVDGDPILSEDFQRAYLRQADLYRRILKDKFTDEMVESLRLRERTLENLINRRLMLHEARRWGVSVSAPEVNAEVKSIPAFAEGGQFSKERYLRVLEANRLTPERFETELAEDLLYRKMEMLVKGAIQITPQEMRDLYARSRGRAKVVYATFPDLATASEKMDALLLKLGEGKSWGEAVRETGVSAGETGFFSFRDPPRGIADPTPFVEEALARAPGEVSSLILGQKTAYLLKVVERRDPDWSHFEKEREGFRQEALRLKREQVFAGWLQGLRRTAAVTVETKRL